VVKASYSTDGNDNEVAAIYGYSKYENGASADDCIGGKFEGGLQGVYGLGTGTNENSVGVLGEAQNGATFNIGVLGQSVKPTNVFNVGIGFSR
jgi:hypothetical protein